MLFLNPPGRHPIAAVAQCPTLFCCSSKSAVEGCSEGHRTSLGSKGEGAHMTPRSGEVSALGALRTRVLCSEVRTTASALSLSPVPGLFTTSEESGRP